MDFEIDHLVVTAGRLEDGVAQLEQALGVTMAPGGAHAFMGTHNRLLGLGEGLYLEVIAIDPAAPSPAQARWFDLDNRSGPARLTNWVARGDGLPAALARAPSGAGRILDAARGGLSWRISVPEDGRLPFDGGFPGLIWWEGDAHPCDTLPESGCRLRQLEIVHPRAEALRAALTPIVSDTLIVLRGGAAPALRAHLDTPGGQRVLE